MAYWKKFIKLEVRLPYLTQICTLGHIKAELTITDEDIWRLDDPWKWKAYIRYGDYGISIWGKAVPKGAFDFNATTHCIAAWQTCEGKDTPYNSAEIYKARVLEYA